ncbi:hypothetical protein [Vibrio parahaemolyticus]|uniref:hypothetical protein n=1 Tax=Vibrio parahaemolyticus TaxID=670 RepID=UPI00041CCB24|nr:hypothetical protein [Vibrio parahaemolyticus]MDF4764789.1 hypothetical protein [Vibrio parahaemolyticus]HBC3407580.1 hypothetical protein [Vibrio parahaemolyticus]HBN6092746.1 hypothetical protein [Vibrio parahaemolyticus]HBN6183583.1 hypothetical protein [Vibrio parahaemolyticus]
MLLEEIKARILAASETAEGLLGQVNDLYVEEIRSEEKILKDALSELHNAGEIDLVEIIRRVDKSSSGYDFFTIQHAFEGALPSLNASVEDVLRCLAHLTQQAGRDLAVGGIYGAFERFCRVEAQRPIDSIGFILSQSELNAYALFLSSSILAYDSDHVVDAIQTTESLIANRNDVIRNQAYFALGRLDVGDAHANVIWELIIGSASGEHESGCCASILRATINFGDAFPSYWSQIEEFLRTFVEGAPPEVLYEISNIVAFQRVNLPEGVLELLVKQLANVSPEHKGIIDNIDHLLVSLVGKGASSIALELLESILVVGVKFPHLDYFSRELLSKHRDLLNHIVTKWFLSGDSTLCHGVSDLLHDVTSKDVELEAEMALLGDEVKQVFVSHKAVGWLFMRPIAAASFILSIYETGSRTTCRHLDQVLYDPLLLSYPGELKRFFLSCIDKGFHVRTCELLLGKLQAYHSDIEKVAGLKELMAPMENINVYWKESNKSMQAAYEDASRGSIIDLIATKQTLLYGNSSIYYVHRGDGEQVRQEMQMQSFSHSTEMPRLNVLDPESLDYILRVYRCERMNNEANS